MPAKLKVQKNGLVVDEYEIKKQEILIGKGEHCDIVLNYPGIGREMARLTAEKDGFYIADVSVQGVFIDNQRITRQRVNPGQEINCGAVQLVLVEEDGFRDQASSATMLWEAAGFAVPPITAYLVSKGKPEEAHVISTEEFVIGRGVKDCQLPVVDNAASKRHARIARAGEKFLLADLNSTNGTYLNAQKVTDVIELKEGDEIRIGHAVFIFRKQLDSSQKPVSPPPANLIDMEQIVKQTDDMLPKAALPETPAKAIASDKKRMRLLIGAVAVAVLFLILIIALKPHGPKLDPARVSAIESLFRDGKLDILQKN